MLGSIESNGPKAIVSSSFCFLEREDKYLVFIPRTGVQVLDIPRFFDIITERGLGAIEPNAVAVVIRDR